MTEFEYEEEVFQKRIYDSSSTSDEDGDDDAQQERRSRKWGFQESFESVSLADAWLEREGCWSIKKAYETLSGRKQVYRCNKASSRGKQCDRAVYLLFEAESHRVLLFVTEAQHSHQSVKVPTGMNKATKLIVDRLLLEKLAPKNIRDSVASEAEANDEIVVPSERQL